MKKVSEVTTAQVVALAREAAKFGDEKMVKIAERALEGSKSAWKKCAQAIREGQG